MPCSHGYYVWQPLAYTRWGRRLLPCMEGTSVVCRSMVHKQVQAMCVRKVRRLGDLLGRDRLHVHCVAFGPPSEDYAVLQGMAAALPLNSFQV